MRARRPHPTPRSRAGVGSAKLILVILVSNALTFGFVWSSQGQIDARIEAAQPSFSYVDDRLERAEAEIERMRSTVTKHSEEMTVLKYNELLKHPAMVDLGNSGAQYIGKGFAVSRIESEPLGTGTLVRGLMINMQSVSHRFALFTVKVAGITHEFTLDVLDAGGSTPFAVYIPEPPTRFGPLLRINFRESTILYRLESEGAPQSSDRS